MILRKKEIKNVFALPRLFACFLLVFAGCLPDMESSFPNFSFFIPSYLSLSPVSPLAPSVLSINGGKSLRGGIVFSESTSDPLFSTGFNLRLSIGSDHSGSTLYACVDLSACTPSNSFFQNFLGEIVASETEIDFFFSPETYPSEGTHTLYLSVVKDSIVSKQISNPLVFDTTPPALSPSLAAGIYTSTGTLSFTCTDAFSGCDTIVFTSSGVDPSVLLSPNFDPFSVLNGNVYSASIPIPSGTTTIRALAVDRSGNVSDIEEWEYEVNPTAPIVPAVDLTEVQDSPVNSSGSATLVWESNTNGTFQIADDSGDCSALAPPEVLLSGTVSASGAQTTTIANSILAEGNNSFKLCFKDSLDQYDSFLFSVTKDTTRPTILSSNPSGGSSNVDASNEHLLITFDEVMTENTEIQIRAFLTYGPVGSETTVELSLPAGVRSWGSATVLDVDLDATLPAVSKVSLRLRADDLTDLAGNSIAGDAEGYYNIQFQTGASNAIRNVIDSNQPICGDMTGNLISCAGTGQDGAFLNVPAQQILVGPFLNPGFSSDPVTVDQTSGLTWKTCPQGMTWSGAGCAGSYTTFTWPEAISQCLLLNEVNANAGYAGIKGWRLASMDDFISLTTLSSDTTSYLIVPIANFPNFPSDNANGQRFWSASTNLNSTHNTSYAWGITAAGGGTVITSKGFVFDGVTPFLAVCVSGNPN